MRSLHHFGVPGRERGNMIAIWKATRTKKKPVWKYAFFQQGCRTCPLCIFQERKARKIPNSISSWAEHWSIGQSCPYCKERPFSERNPQLLSTATIATILNFILRGLWSRSEPEQQFSDAKVSYHLKTTIFFGSKFQCLEWSLFFLMGPGRNWSTTHGKATHFSDMKIPTAKSPKHLCIQPFVGKPNLRPLCRCSKRDGHWRSPSDQRDEDEICRICNGRPRRSRSAKKSGSLLEAVAVGGGGRGWMFSLLDSGSHDLDGGKRGFSGWLDFWQWLYPWCPPLILGMQLPGIISIHQAMPPRHEATRIP